MPCVPVPVYCGCCRDGMHVDLGFFRDVIIPPHGMPEPSYWHAEDEASKQPQRQQLWQQQRRRLLRRRRRVGQDLDWGRAEGLG